MKHRLRSRPHPELNGPSKGTQRKVGETFDHMEVKYSLKISQLLNKSILAMP